MMVAGLPRISVVMPSLNQAEFIEESIQSIIDQEYPNLEYFILDGGSTDGSQTIIERYSSSLTYWHSQPDQGQADAIIQGFKMATGEILGWVNSDDVLLKGTLRSIADAYAEYPQGGIFAGDYLVLDVHGLITQYKVHTRHAAWLGRHGLQVISPDWFFTRDAYEQVGGIIPGYYYVMDTDLFFRMILEGIEFVYLKQPLVGFRVHPEAKTVKGGKDFSAEYHELRRRIEAKYPGQHSWRQKKWIYRLLQFFTGNYLRRRKLTAKWKGKYWKEFYFSR